ncbi:MAG: MarR family transcriptional regulator [Clostridia bacterium]|nr:MarR family transcriptional regulator [Clostridia bacterium]
MENNLDVLDKTQEKTARAREIVRQFIATARLHHAVVDGMVAGMGVHHSQHRMLMYLAKHEKLPSQKAIADHFDISPAAVAVTLKRLEKDGYIRRDITGEDNRCNEISITEKGRATVECSRYLFDHIDSAMFDGLDDAQLESFLSVLNTIRANLERMDGDTSCAPKHQGGDMS